MTNGLEHSELTDGFAFGVTILMMLTGRVALGLTQACDEALDDPSLASSIADDIAAWPDHVATEVATVVARLTTQRKRLRMQLPEALRLLAALGTAADAAQETVQPDSTRLCLVCEENPREVRFACGHSCCCRHCLPLMLKDGKCATCREPFGTAPLLDQGTHVRAEPTFQLGVPQERKGGRGGRGRGR